MDNSLFFMENKEEEDEEIEIPGISCFKFPKDMEGHKKGDIIPWKIRKLSKKENERLVKDCTKISYMKGKKKEKLDNTMYMDKVITQCVTFPNLKDKSLLDAYKCIDPVDLMNELLSEAGDFTKISMEILSLNGMTDTDNDLVEEAKN